MPAPAWIKMRVDLDTDPRVLTMADLIAASSAPYVLSPTARDLLGVTPTVTRDALRDVTLASLYRVWRDANRHTRDGVFTHCALDHLDTISRIPGFGRAMAHVGWAVEDPAAKTVTLVNFLEMNSPAKESGTNAQRQKRYRERHRNAPRNVTGDVTQPVTDPSRVTTDREVEAETDSTGSTPTPQARARPPGYPATETQARSIAGTIGVDPDYAATVWHELEGTGGTNNAGQAITSFANHVKARWNHKQSKDAGKQPRGAAQGGTEKLPQNVAYARWMQAKEELAGLNKRSFTKAEDVEAAQHRRHVLERTITELEATYHLTTT